MKATVKIKKNGRRYMYMFSFKKDMKLAKVLKILSETFEDYEAKDISIKIKY